MCPAGRRPKPAAANALRQPVGADARPRATTCCAILREASSIISPSNMTAPRRSPSGRELVGLEDAHGPLVRLGRRREDLVAERDLVGMQRPLAVEAEQLRATRDGAEALGIADLRVRPVDRLQAEGAGGRQDLPEHVVPLVAAVLGLGRADRELRHADARGEVSRPEDERLDPVRRLCDPLDVDESERALDLHLEADPARQPELALELREQPVGELDVAGGLGLRQHDAVEVRARALDDVDDVAEAPAGARVVHAHHLRGREPLLVVQGIDDVLARGVVLLERGDRVLEVEEDLVGRRAPRPSRASSCSSRERPGTTGGGVRPPSR